MRQQRDALLDGEQGAAPFRDGGHRVVRHRAAELLPALDVEQQVDAVPPGRRGLLGGDEPLQGARLEAAVDEAGQLAAVQGGQFHGPLDRDEGAGDDEDERHPPGRGRIVRAVRRGARPLHGRRAQRRHQLGELLGGAAGEGRVAEGGEGADLPVELGTGVRDGKAVGSASALAVGHLGFSFVATVCAMDSISAGRRRSSGSVTR
ncbi:hypothetical protein AUW26_18830 [Streptomyces sp. CC71]|nr:hypothetical protein AUW26_18830 [Streptomyces sp. CC71]